MYKITILILTLLEAKITYMTFFSESLGFRKFLILHILVITVLFFSNQYKKIDAFIYNRLSLTIPFVGIFLYLVDIVFLKKNDFHIVEDVFDFEKFIDSKKNLNELNLEKELKILSALDTMETESAENKKNFIINYHPESIKSKVKILRKGLTDKDIEIVHYSAVKFNLISEQFDKKLRNYKKKYFKTNEKVDFDNLINFYKKYLESNILEGDILDNHRTAYIELLEDKIKEDNSIWYHTELLSMYLSLERYEIIKTKCYNFLDNGIKNPKIYEFLIVVYYKDDNLVKLKELYNLCKQEKIEISNKIKNIFKICGLEG